MPYVWRTSSDDTKGDCARIQSICLWHATSFIDGLYRAENVSSPSSGIVTVRCDFVPVDGGINNTINLGINTTGFYGRYTWSKIYDYQNRARENPKDFIVNTNNGLIGLSTAAEVYRTRGLI